MACYIVWKIYIVVVYYGGGGIKARRRPTQGKLPVRLCKPVHRDGCRATGEPDTMARMHYMNFLATLPSRGILNCGLTGQIAKIHGNCSCNSGAGRKIPLISPGFGIAPIEDGGLRPEPDWHP